MSVSIVGSVPWESATAYAAWARSSALNSAGIAIATCALIMKPSTPRSRTQIVDWEVETRATDTLRR
ncbi:hypothetical protein GCM10010197_03530 [Nocardioides luteus]|uniref:Uncharacterized protein n=1 Tax=Nocardioides luteus TaxID=1844 RepID=A0ABQ5SZG6_9ACTN|nr:hypothetical protein GCM10010197_03530 [Nocardioides luteus]GLJ69577.1 hypothetical protein GCM10017579_36130 [Nocardioides luteus]